MTAQNGPDGIDVLHAILTDSRTGDEWGDTIGPLFDIADALYIRDESIPDAWQYRPGLHLATEDEARQESYVLDMILSAVDAGDCTWDDVRAVGNALDDPHAQQTGVPLRPVPQSTIRNAWSDRATQPSARDHDHRQ